MYLHANSNAQTCLPIRAVDSLHVLSFFKTYKANVHDMFSTYLSCAYVRGNISYHLGYIPACGNHKNVSNPCVVLAQAFGQITPVRPDYANIIFSELLVLEKINLKSSSKFGNSNSVQHHETLTNIAGSEQSSHTPGGSHQRM